MSGLGWNYLYPSLCYLIGGAVLLAVLWRYAASSRPKKTRRYRQDDYKRTMRGINDLPHYYWPKSTRKGGDTK